MLVSNLVSGGLWIAVLVLLDSWPLAVVGAAYVCVASPFLAAAPGQKLAWTVPWLGAVGLWTLLLGMIDGGTTGSALLMSLYAGTVVGTLCYLIWQAVAAPIRLLMVSLTSW